MATLGNHRLRITLGVLSILLLIPLVLTAIAPLLAPLPTQATVWSAAPLPNRDEPLPGFQELFEPIPLIVRDLPDAESQQVVVFYDLVTMVDRRNAFAMIEAARSAVPVPDSLKADWESWLNEIMSSTEPFNFSSDDVRIPASILIELQSDERNGDRLSNLAIAIYIYGLTSSPNGFETMYSFEPVWARGSYRAILESAWDAFPESRGATINLAVARSLSIPADRILSYEMLASWLDSHPEDATAMMLLAQFYAPLGTWGTEHISRENMRERVSVFVKSTEGVKAALGHAFLGDFHMVDATGLQDAAPAPYVSRQNYLAAVREYDEALKLSDDVSLYIARADALMQLGDMPNAIASQERAIKLSPDTMTSKLQLAGLLLEVRGDESSIRENVLKSREFSREALAMSPHDDALLIKDIEFREYTALPTLTYYRPDRFYIPLGVEGGGRGGGAIVTFDDIPIYQVTPLIINPESHQRDSPISWAVNYAVLASVILGDPVGVAEDLANLNTRDSALRWFSGEFITKEVEYWQVAANIVADPQADHGNEAGLYFIDYKNSFKSAGLAVRFAGLPNRAREICSAALSVAQRNGESADEQLRCVAENAYLAGDYDAAAQAYRDINDTLMVGYVAERQGYLHEAEKLYQQVIESNTLPSYLAMLRLANMTINDDPARAMELYSTAIYWANETDGCDDQGECIEIMDSIPLAHSNLGIARLQMHADSNGNIDCAGSAWEACSAAYMDFDTALKSDPYNPVFLMNQAWVARLLGDIELSAQLMNQALESDTSLYPVLNDLGVEAMYAGDTSSANEYFRDAISANPQYDLALWNMGVLKMHQGVWGVLQGQAYLARAIFQNPSFIGSPMEFRTDERVYRVEINETLRPGAGWSFGTASSIVTSAFGFLTFVLMTLQITFSALKSKLEDMVNGWTDSASKWGSQRFASRFAGTLGDRWMRWLPLVITLAILVFSTSWIARRADPTVAAASTALALFAVVLALVVHETAHSLTAWRLNAQVQAAQWAPGMVLALVLLPFGLGSGPFPGQKVTARNDSSATRVSLAGPLANLTVAVFVYFLFMLQPLPALRLISQVQLAAMSYALLPFEPLDGASLSRTRPTLVAILGGVGLIGGLLLGTGVI